MIFGVNPTKDAVVIAQATGSGETFVIKSIRSIQFQARSGDGLNELLQRLVVIFDLSTTSRGSTIALLGSSSGRFKSSVEAIKGEAITELAAAKSGVPVVRVTAASLKKVLGCAPGQKWQARAEERFNPGSSRKNWSHGAVGAAAAAFKIAAGQSTGTRSAIISPCVAATDSPDESSSSRNFDSVSGEEEWTPRYNIAPTQPIPVIRQNPKEPIREISLMRWGLIPSWAKDASGAARMINARSETASTKPAFRDAMKSRRCLIPADGFTSGCELGKLSSPTASRSVKGSCLRLRDCGTAGETPVATGSRPARS